MTRCSTSRSRPAVCWVASNRVCATQKSGSSPSSPNQYNYACANYLVGLSNSAGLWGSPSVHNGEGYAQLMRGQFYL